MPVLHTFFARKKIWGLFLKREIQSHTFLNIKYFLFLFIRQILNFTQIVSLAGGLPLKWPPAIEALFEGFSAASSAGSTLLIPDCELSHLPTADAFYMKQIAFTLLPPIVAVTCVLVWKILLWCRKTRRAFHLKKKIVVDYTVLSIVLFFFLLYPLLCQVTFSTVKCPVIGDRTYLMSDLEEPCFEGRHLHYVIFLTIPQLFLYVLGMPLATFFILNRKTEKELKAFSFRMRYGLLYQGYRPGRVWWEVVIAIRKLSLVAVGSFGVMWGAVDIQAFAALLVIFVSLVIHLVGKPFVNSDNRDEQLHNLEFASLIICWLTFWGGLLFFLGESALDGRGVPHSILVTLSVAIVLTNVTFAAYSLRVFVREYLKDRQNLEEIRKRRRSTVIQKANKTSVAPRAATLFKRDSVEDTLSLAHL